MISRPRQGPTHPAAASVLAARESQADRQTGTRGAERPACGPGPTRATPPARPTVTVGRPAPVGEVLPTAARAPANRFRSDRPTEWANHLHSAGAATSRHAAPLSLAVS